MMSKRSRYVSESTCTSDEEMDYPRNNQQARSRKPTRIPKCFTKNALMARENRLRKKQYIASLEQQASTLKEANKDLNKLLSNQSCTIDNLKKEVKYLKNVLANSSSIGKLLQAINAGTGMAVSTSINKKLSIPIAKKNVPENVSRHPWEETATYPTYPTPESTMSSPNFQQLDNELLLDMDIPIEMDNEELLEILNEDVLESPIMDEHNYYNSFKGEADEETVTEEEEEDDGICLHVSKNKVSLEFCQSCSDKAAS
ncbi:unnamed protein product [Ceutorhynchus assimilis]|uniref:BZIP domain-containing protein n=1 Tax=Ceutorhynchus assimilis TaxID=467358 RepID=A0A9P0DLV2_9CUCU|nr:unnamed protein product [Ceutorhynchus assimilis]